MSIEQNICDAVDIIVDRAISQAGFDRTITAVVVECVDPIVGKYKVKYQDSLYYATSDNASTKYNEKAEVYVLVPGNDFSKDKKILGTVKSLGANYITSVEGDEGYEYIGTNGVEPHTQLALCSYKTEVVNLYNSENIDGSMIEIDETAIKEYLTQSTHLIAGAEFKTAIPKENRNYGNYGIIFGLEFKDDATQQSIIKEYTVDVDNMLGQPYNLNNFSRQVEEFEIKGSNFVKVRYINLFTTDFPHQDETKPSDIFVKNIELNGALQLDSSALDSYYLSLRTPQGTFFPEDVDLESLTLNAEVKIKGKVVQNSSHNMAFYWFVEHAGVDSKHVSFCKYGGQGWKCLNDYVVIEAVTDEEGNVVSTQKVEWTAAQDSYEVKKEDCSAYQTKYKCVCLYNNEITIEKEIIIKNYQADYNIEIISSSGTEFTYDVGVTTLQCVIDNPQNLSYNYYWSKKNNVGTFELLPETEDENYRYQMALALKQELEDGLANNTFFGTQTYAFREGAYTSIEDYMKENLQKESFTYSEALNSVSNYFVDKTITRLEKGILHNLAVKTITNFSVYSCSVYGVDEEGNEKYVGNASIKITNSFDKQPGYTLVIHNGTQVFKYNEAGLSPAHKSNENPIEVPTLTFTLFDENGNALDEEVVRRSCKVKWTIPTKDTMLMSNIQGDETEVTAEEGFKAYTNTLLFDYDILGTYNVNRNNNDIRLEVTYQGKTVYAKTNLTFLKEGDSGTNGTDYICRIVMNAPEDEILPELPVLTLSGSNRIMNYNIQGDGSAYGTDAVKYKNWFRVQLWNLDELVYDGIAGDSTYEVEWKMLVNKYSSKLSDTSMISIDRGEFTCGDFDSAHPANIVKAIVTYEEKQYSATIPITTILASNSSYKASFKEKTGFNSVIYSSDGVKPKYDATNPFEVEVLYNENGTWIDITQSTKYPVTYEWNIRGFTYRKDDVGDWIEEEPELLRNYTLGDVADNMRKYMPASAYDGQCVNVGLKVVVKRDQTTVATLHKPIHFLLNKYGLSALNDWDGNSIDINEEGGVILSPQVGAGKKNADNTFTGILMGTVDDPHDTTSGPKTGLIGYSSGQRSILLDAESGKAEFGTEHRGRIVIDPSHDTAEIRSGNYVDGESGLLIDFTTPIIQYGSGKFAVNDEGELTAKGGGSIAGWGITDTALIKDDVGISSDNSENTNIAFWAGSTKASSAPFRVDFNGDIVANSGYIGGFNIDSQNIWTGTKTTSTTAIPASGAIRLSTANYSASICGTSADTWRFNIGSYFGIKASGAMFCNNGYIGGWNINSTGLTANSGKTKLNNNGSISVADGEFYVDTSGNTTIKGNCNISGTLDAGACNSLLVTGSLTVTGTGKIGGCSVNAAGLYGTGWSLTSTGLNCDKITMDGDDLYKKTVEFKNTYYRPNQDDGWMEYVKAIEYTTNTVLGQTVVTGITVTTKKMAFITGSVLKGTFVCADVSAGDATE